MNFDDVSSVAAVRSSCSEMIDASDVSFSSVMNSLPIGGIAIRIACGTTMRRRMRRRDMPSARPASSCPGSTDKSPARMISDMYAASLRDSVIHAAMNGVNQLPAKPLHHVGSAYQTKYRDRKSVV